MKLIVTHESDGRFRAILEDYPNMDSTGKTWDEAIGSWIRYHGSHIGLTIQYDISFEERRGKKD